MLIQCLGGRPIPGLSRPLPRTLALFALILLLTAESLANILPAATGPSYEGFLEALSRHVPRNEKTLANLNTGYYFERDCLIDYRNLAYLEDVYKRQRLG